MQEIDFHERKIHLGHQRTLAYRACGEITQTQFVFLHGLGGCAGAWEETQVYLYQRHHISSIAFDLPGHGFSGDPLSAPELTPEAMAKQVGECLQQLPFNQKPILVGHCLGGMVATQVAARDESMFSGLALINTIIKTPGYMRLINPLGLFSQMLLLVARVNSGKRSKTRRDYARFKHTGDFSLFRYLNDIAFTSLRNHLSAFAPVFAYDATREAKKLALPIEIIAGTRDKLFLPFVARHMARALPQAALVWIDKGNHVMLLAKHETIARKLVEFHGRVQDLNS